MPLKEKGFMLMEIIVAFLIMAIALGVIFQNFSVSLSSFYKGDEKLSNAFRLEEVGVWYWLANELPSETEDITLKSWPFEIDEKEYQFIEIQLKKQEEEKIADKIFLFSRKE